MDSDVLELRAGLQKHQSGDVAGAERVYRSILEEDPDHAGARHLLGLIYFSKRQYPQALTEIERAIARNDTKAVYWNNKAAVLRELGLAEEAKRACERALAIAPRYPDALSNLALCLWDLGEKDRAYHVLRDALAIDPNHKDALRHVAGLCQDLGRADEAFQWRRRRIDKAPDDVEAWCAMGDLQMALGRPAAAVRSFQHAAELVPDDPQVQLSLGRALAAQGKVTEANVAFGQAARLRPDRPSWRYRHLGCWPQVFADQASVDQHFRDLDRQLDEARQDGFAFDWRRCLEDGFCPPFGLTHHGRCCRALKEKYAALFAPHFPQTRPRYQRTERLRIGFLVTAGKEAGFVRDMAQIVARLDPVRFEPVVLCSRGGMEQCRKSIGTDHVRWVAFPPDFEGAVATIRASRCDILYHRQIGTDVSNYFFPFARMAPIQCTGWATHGTTGIEAVDYYISSDLMETDGSGVQYTERLFQLHNTFPTYQVRIRKPPPSSREDFGLPSRGAIYFCPQRVEKLEPAFDWLLRGVLEADGDGTVLMLKGRHPAAFSQLVARLRKTLGPGVAERVAFAPNLPARDYYRLFTLADVILDAPHYSTSLTGFDACSFGIPIVTWPGPRKVERYAQGIYRKIGIEGLTVETESDYVATAAQIGRDPELRRSFHEKIIERSETLFEDAQAIKEHEHFFEYAWGHRDALQTC